MRQTHPKNVEQKVSKIAVAVRVRPSCEPLVSTHLLHDLRPKHRLTEHWRWTDSALYLGDAPQGTFDQVFPPACSNAMVYDAFAYRFTQAMLAGYNACIYAFGQTNSGKTFTMCGTREDPGIIPRSAIDVFERLAHIDAGTVGLLRVSLIELYNETFRDLLYNIPSFSFQATERYEDETPDGPQATLSIVDDPARGPLLANAREVIVRDVGDVLRLIAIAEHRRSVAQNDAHAHASRSHLLFQFTFEAQDIATKHTRVSTLRVVDMAGSETPVNLPTVDAAEQQSNRAASLDMAHRARTEAQRQAAASRRYEGANIRKSLLAVVRCADIVQRNQQDAHHPQQHVPFRDSRLTRLLCDTLGGSTETAIVCTMNPNEQRESLATLRFALQAQKILTFPRVVHALDRTALLDRYHDEIASLAAESQRLDASYARAHEVKTARQRARKREEAKIMQKFAAVKDFMIQNKNLQKVQRRSMSPQPEVLAAVQKQNLAAMAKVRTPAFLQAARREVPVELQRSVEMNEKVLRKKMERLQLNKIQRAADRAHLEEKVVACQAENECLKALEVEVAELTSRAEQKKASLLVSREKSDKANAHHMKKCCKYISQLDRRLGTSSWARFKNAFLRLFTSEKASAVTLEADEDLRQQLDDLKSKM